MNIQNKGKKFSFNIAGKEATFEFGKFAYSSEMSIFASWGDTRIQVNIDVGEADSTTDFFPLTVEYLEKLYAAGTISRSKFIKRERFPGLDSILAMRMIDRIIRPRFPKGFNTPVNIVISVLAYDAEYDPVILAVNTTSLGLLVSNLPFKEPIVGLRISLDNEEKIFANTGNVLVGSDDEGANKMNMVLGLDVNGIIMFDAGYAKVSKELIKEGMDVALTEAKIIVASQKEVQAGLVVEKKEYPLGLPVQEIVTYIEESFSNKLLEAVKSPTKAGRVSLTKEVFDQIKEEKNIDQDEDSVWTSFNVNLAVDHFMKKLTRQEVLASKKHVDGRINNEVRPLEMELDILPRVHGSARFSRGDTSVLSIVTLGSEERNQITDGMTGEKEVYYMHHYNDQPFTYGEVGRIRYNPSRRAMGHGALAEKALLPVVPDVKDFPYTIRVVSEIMTSAGSTSMASTCGSSLALMAAGVPIKEAVAGIHVGMVSRDNFSEYVLLTDIIDIEDFYGDMDFKVTGTRDGVTAIQMDQKQMSVPINILKEALDQATDARMFIMDEMDKVISKSRTELSPYAPQTNSIDIDTDLIGKLIGPGGKNIKEITAQVDVDISIHDDGQIVVTSKSKEDYEKAVRLIKESLYGSADYEPLVAGEKYDVRVEEILKFGLVVEVVDKDQSGLIHISELSDSFVKDIEKFAKVGDVLQAHLKSIEDGNKLRFTLKS